jgi:HEPN domain-containing protein
MSAPPRRLRVVRQWIQKAENDLDVAENTVKRGESGPLDMVCFHAQQCIEKYVKAVLTLHGIDPPRSRDLTRLAARLPDPNCVGLTPIERRRLTRYATVMRYPGDYDPITLDEAWAAVEIARRARASLRGLLPAELCEP